MAKRLKAPAQAELPVITSLVIPPDKQEVSESFVAVLHAISSGIDPEPMILLDRLGRDYYPWHGHPTALPDRVKFNSRRSALKAVTDDLNEAKNFIANVRTEQDEDGCRYDIQRVGERLNRTANKISRMIDQIPEDPSNFVVMGSLMNSALEVNREILSLAGRGPVVEQKNIKVSGKVQHSHTGQIDNGVSDVYSSHGGSTHDLGAIDATFEEIEQ